MREATLEEVSKIILAAKHIGELDIPEFCAKALKFYPTARTVSFSFADEYNDQDYDLRMSGVTAYDAEGKELDEPDFGGDYELDNSYHNWAYQGIGAGSSEGNESAEYKLDVVNQQLLEPKLPKIYLDE